MLPSAMSATIERVARRIAAENMALVNDPYGERLPDELWTPCIPQAREYAYMFIDDLTMHEDGRDSE